MNEINSHTDTIEVPEESEIRNPEILQLQSEIENIRNPKKSIINNLITLGVSIFIFFSMGLFSNTVADILIIIGVLFIHELGHLAGMKLFKYKNVSMMFIPFLGAAVSGHETSPSGSRKAMVSLMGPLPGIFIAVGILFYNRDLQNPLLAQFANFSLLINAFNLLPFYPLDGGRFFDDILFSRNPYIEIIFKLLAIIVLGIMAFESKSWALGIFVFFILITISQTFLSAKITREMKKNHEPGSVAYSEKVPYEFVQTVNVHINEHLAKKNKSMELKIRANVILAVWNKLLSSLPSIKASFAFIVFYIVIFIASIIFFIASDPTHTQSAPVGNFSWEEFVPDEGTFAVNMPGYPKWDSHVIPLKKGNMVMNYYSIQYKDADFTVYCTALTGETGSLRNEPSSQNEKSTDNTAQLKSKVITKKDITLGKMKGKEIEEINAEGYHCITRSYRMGTRVYSLAVSMKKNIFNRNDAVMFLDSFRLRQISRGK